MDHCGLLPTLGGYRRPNNNINNKQIVKHFGRLPLYFEKSHLEKYRVCNSATFTPGSERKNQRYSENQDQIVLDKNLMHSINRFPDFKIVSAVLSK